MPIAAHGLHQGERGHSRGIGSQDTRSEGQSHTPAIKERAALGFGESSFGPYQHNRRTPRGTGERRKGIRDLGFLVAENDNVIVSECSQPAIERFRVVDAGYGQDATLLRRLDYIRAHTF
jgi:hypothetical protein